jgi:3,4-dihydroxy 2-butanone 4-phosphate synthase/GTP cyclohydrolase II
VFDGSVTGLADAASLLGRPTVPAARPWVVLRYAQTLDGRLATRTGASRWIGSEDERRLSHALRAACDAVAVGIGTVLADDPKLTVRMVPGANPIRVVFDSRRRTPPDAAILGDEASTIIVATEGGATTPAWSHLAALLEVPAGPGGVDLGAALGALRHRGVRVLLVEGGARLITSFLAQGLVDRIICSISPRVIGAGVEAIDDLGVATVGAGLRLDDTTVTKVGADIVLAGDVVPATRRAPEHAGPVGSLAGGE